MTMKPLDAAIGAISPSTDWICDWSLRCGFLNLQNNLTFYSLYCSNFVPASKAGIHILFCF